MTKFFKLAIIKISGEPYKLPKNHGFLQVFMKKLSPHFSFEELSYTSLLCFKDQNTFCASFYLQELTALSYYVLEPIRALLDTPLVITSAYRCPALNDYVKGVPNSQHIGGEAADFIPLNCCLEKAFDKIRICKFIHFGQLIMEPGWIHVSLGFPFRPLKKCGEVIVK